MKTKFNGILTLLLVFVVQITSAQTISGKVSDDKGVLPMAAVLLKGTTKGTETGMDGSYSIKAKKGDVLVFSFVGMKAMEVTVGSAKVINVELKADNMLDVVVIKGAMGIEKIPDAVTSTQKTVSGETLAKTGTSNAVEALVGQVSGMQITKTGTGVGGSSTLTLRTPTSITSGSGALIIIDGNISSMGVLKSIPAELIESTNIIKGAQGAALYGSDGVNGVLIVNTKSSKKSEKLNISINTTVNFNSIAFMPERQRKYGQGWNHGDDPESRKTENGAWGWAFDHPDHKDKVIAYGFPLYDVNGDGKIDINLDSDIDPTGTFIGTEDEKSAIHKVYAPIDGNNIADFFKTGITTNNSITFNAGGKNKSVLFSVGQMEEDFVVDGDKASKTNLLFKGNYKIDKWSIRTGVNYIKNKTTQTGALYNKLVNSSSDIDITAYKKYPDNVYGWTHYNSNNPYWTMKHQRDNYSSEFASVFGALMYEYNKNINFKYQGNFKSTAGDSFGYRDGWLNNTKEYNIGDTVDNISSYLSKSNSMRKSYNGNFTTNFEYKLSEDFNLSSLVGLNYQDNKYTVTSAGGTDLIIPGLYTVANLKKPTKPSSLSNYSTRTNSYGLFANIDLAYKDFLFFNVTGRNEWLSTLSKENNSFFYPSAGVSFIPTKAFEGMKNNVLNRMKIAANWTKVGNANGVGAYEIYPTAVLGSGFPYNSTGPTEGLASYRVSRSITDTNIKPEFVTTAEVTAELGLFNNRLNITSAYFQQQTTDLITYQSTSVASGLTNNKINIGEMETKGLEVDIEGTPVKTENFSWSLRASYATNESIVTKVTDQTDEVVLAENSVYGRYAKVGEVFPLLKGSVFERHEGKIIVDKATGNPKITTGLENFGRTTPKHTYNFGTNINYKGLELSATMDYRTGHHFYSATARTMAFNGTLPVTASTDRMQGGAVLPNSVYKENGAYVANSTVKTGGDTYGSLVDYYTAEYKSGESLIFDASAFKVRQIALSYTIKGEDTGFEAITFGVHTRNPFRIFSKENLGFNDPEAAGSSGVAGSGKYPSLKTYGFSLNVKF